MSKDTYRSMTIEMKITFPSTICHLNLCLTWILLGILNNLSSWMAQRLSLNPIRILVLEVTCLTFPSTTEVEVVEVMVEEVEDITLLYRITRCKTPCMITPIHNTWTLVLPTLPLIINTEGRIQVVNHPTPTIEDLR